MKKTSYIYIFFIGCYYFAYVVFWQDCFVGYQSPNNSPFILPHYFTYNLYI